MPEEDFHLSNQVHFQAHVPPLRGSSFCYRYPGFRAAHSILGYDRSSLAGLGAGSGQQCYLWNLRSQPAVASVLDRILLRVLTGLK